MQILRNILVVLFFGLFIQAGKSSSFQLPTEKKAAGFAYSGHSKNDFPAHSSGVVQWRKKKFRSRAIEVGAPQILGPVVNRINIHSEFLFSGVPDFFCSLLYSSHRKRGPPLS